MKILKSLKVYLRLRYIFLLVLLTIILALLELIFWYLLVPLLGGESQFQFFFMKSLSEGQLFLIVVIVRGIFFILNAWITNSILFRALTYVRTRLIESVISSPLEKYERVGKVKLSNDIILNTQIAIDSVLTNLLKLVSNFTILGAIVVAFFLLYGKMVLFIVLGVFILFILALTLLMPKVRKWSLQIVEANNKVISNTDYVLQNIKEIKVNSFSISAILKIIKVFKHYSQIQTLIRFFQLMPKYLVETTVYLSIAIFLNSNHSGDVLVDISVLALMSMRTLPLINEMIIALNGLNAGKGGRDQLELSLLGLEHTHKKFIRESCKTDSLLHVENLSFSYDDSKLLFDNLNFTLNSGEIVGLTGESGTGKSTLLDIILGMRSIVSGNVTFRKNISIFYICQRPFLPEVSLVDYAKEYSGREDVWPDFSALLDKFNLGFLSNQQDLILSDNTLPLSGGQRQKIALAACLCSDAELNILDEATSGMDSHSLNIAIQAIQELRGKRTFLIVTHQVDFHVIYDKVIML